MSGSEQSGGGFARGFIYGALLAAIGFATYAVLNPLKPGMAPEPTQDEETQSQAVVPATQDAAQSSPAEIEPDAPAQAAVQADVSPPAGPQLGAPTIDEESGLSAGNDAAPTLGAPDTQFAIAAPENPDRPATGSDAPDAPVVTDSLTNDAPAQSVLAVGNALEDNAVAVIGSDDRPYFAIILEDVGDQGFPRENLTALKAAISISVPVADPQAGEIAGFYKDAGFEVVALLPDASVSVDQVDAGLAAYFQAVPNAASVLSTQAGSFATVPELGQALMAGLGRTGHGVLSFAAEGAVLPGLADGAGIPNAQIFRVIDERPEPENVTLALERAMAEAKETGVVIVTGRTNSDTITTLFAWLLGPGSSSVKIVPVSAAIGRLNE